MSKRLTPPFRADIVGSFLRPQRIKDARKAYSAGTIDAASLRNVEDECVKELVRQQKAAGLQVITDGEYRCAYWHLDFFWGFQGIEHVELDHGYYFHDLETARGSIRLSGKISGEKHPFVEHFKFIKPLESPGIIARQTMPAPAQLYAELFRDDNGKTTRRIYPDDKGLIEDIAAAYQLVINDLYAAGCRNIQFDDCTWGMVCDTDYWKQRNNSAYDLQRLQETYLTVNNLATAGRPADLTLTTHVCRGNYNSSWAAKGGYDAVAATLFAREDVDAFYLEYDDYRSGGFEPLASVPDGKIVVLGLVTTKRPQLEDKQAVEQRIREASRHVPIDRLCLSPQCGFASCEIGNKLSADDQWQKIALVRDIASDVWGE